MHEISGDLFEIAHDEWLVVTTNGVVTAKGLVMGAGVAKTAAEKFPGLAQTLGEHVKSQGNVAGAFPEWKVISWPTKPEWHELEGRKHPGWQCAARMKSPECLRQVSNLVISGTAQVVALVDELSLSKVYLPRPGCGLGGLDWSKVGPWLHERLDDRFIVVNR